MKPSFALVFTEAAVAILHRTSQGWMELGSAEFDAPDFAERLAYLRGLALGLDPRGLTTKLVLPNSQIRYMTLPSPGADAAGRRARILKELEGRTPYPVDKLVFDWWGKGAALEIAVVAQETLAEAEAFATEHRLNPVSFVAIPEDGRFGAEPWFGTTTLAQSLLAAGEKVDRDQDPIRIAGRVPRPDPLAQTALPRTAAAEAEPGHEVPVAEPLPEPSPGAGLTPAAETGAQDATGGSASVQAADPNAARPPPAAPRHRDVTAPTIADQAEPAPAPPRAARITPTLPSAETATARAAAEPRPGKKAAVPQRDASKPAASALSGTPKPGSAAPPRLAAVPGGRGGGARAVRLVQPEAEAQPARISAVAGAGQTRLNRSGTGPIVTAPGIALPRERKLSVVPKTGAPAPASEDRMRTGADPARTAFGKRAAPRGKPRFLGLILTGVLLLLLAAVAFWSSYIVASKENAPESPATAAAPGVTPAADGPVTAPAAEAAASSPPAEVPLPERAATAAVSRTASAAGPGGAGTPAPAQVTDPPVNTAAEAPAADGTAADGTAADGTAADGTASPAAPVAAAVETATVKPPEAITARGGPPVADVQDEILLPMIDPVVQTGTAVALAVPVARADSLPLSQPNPPPFGTQYRFDTAGLIIPTPEGIMTPEGVRLVAGRPARVPPPRPAIEPLPVAAIPLPAEGTGAALTGSAGSTVDAVFADPALAGARPRLRPEDAVAPAATENGTAETDDGAALPPADTAGLAGLAPRARPPGALAQAGTAVPAQDAADQAAPASIIAGTVPQGGSPLAVAISRKPAARPARSSPVTGEGAISLAAADASLVPETASRVPDAPAKPADTAASDDPAAVELDEPEVASAAPSIPTRASVAKQATFKNKINLSKVNLIGVFGTASNRTAMVRQSNGRFVKVEVGDRIDGGRVAAISDRELQYVKNGTTLTLGLPKS